MDISHPRLGKGDSVLIYYPAQQEIANYTNKTPVYSSEDTIDNPSGQYPHLGIVIDVNGVKHRVMATYGSRDIWVKVGSAAWTSKSNVLPASLTKARGMTIDPADNTVWIVSEDASSTTYCFTYNSTTQTLDRKSSGDFTKGNFATNIIMFVSGTSTLELGSNSTTDVYVYDVSTAATRAVSRASTKDYNAPANTSASVSAGSVKYFIEHKVNAVGYALNVDDNSRATEYDFTLDSSNSAATGAYLDGTYIAIVDSGDNKTHLYDALIKNTLQKAYPYEVVFRGFVDKTVDSINALDNRSTVTCLDRTTISAELRQIGRAHV